jgi:predicted hydrolase (HD superfamily)
MYPAAEDHPFKGSEILREKGFDEDFRNAILAHANYSGVPRETLLQKTLFACDELAGFITAVTYVRPNKSIDEVEVKSVKKKMKDKAFARTVSREDIENGAADLGIPLDEHIEFCINAMRIDKERLGL